MAEGTLRPGGARESSRNLAFRSDNDGYNYLKYIGRHL